MQHVTGRTFGPKEMVETDGATFTDCTFDSAFLAYRGGEHPLFDRCTFTGECSWQFFGAALRTIQLLQRIGNDRGGENFISAVFRKGVYFADEIAPVG